jgi:hypothetical protein
LRGDQGRKEIDITNAAAVMTRSVRASPKATLSSMSARVC